MNQIFTRDNLLWTLTCVGAVLFFIVGSTTLIPPAYAHTVKDVAAVIGFVAALLRKSELPLSPEGRQQYLADQLKK